MSEKNSKQFGVWMDTHQAVIVGKEQLSSGDFVVIGQVKNELSGNFSSENTANNAAQTTSLKFFKEITSYMQNAEEVHVTGTGISQEQFIHYMADTAQFKNTVTKESTSNQMSDENLVKYITEKFN